MPSLLSLLVLFSIPGEGPTPPAPAGVVRLATPQSPQVMLRAMVRQAQRHAKEAGATVEVIGIDEEQRLKLLALDTATRARLAFQPTDSLGHQALRAFMAQDPSRPSPVLVMPTAAGGKRPRPEDRWLK